MDPVPAPVEDKAPTVTLEGPETPEQPQPAAVREEEEPMEHEQPAPVMQEETVDTVSKASSNRPCL